MNTTQVHEAQAAGDADAASQLAPVVYDQLRKLATRYLRQERPGHSPSAPPIWCTKRGSWRTTAAPPAPGGR